MSILSLGNLLSATINTSNQSQAQLRLNAVQTALQNRLNNQIAQLENQASDTDETASLQNQLAPLTAKNSAYLQVTSFLASNAGLLSDLTARLKTLNTAATNGDSATFDRTLAGANGDVSKLQLVNLLPGLQPDGVQALLNKGLGIKSSATYDLSTPAGQAQALSDIQSAKTVIGQISTNTAQNLLIAGSASTALTTQINEINRKLRELSTNQTDQIQPQIARLQAQEQEQLHVIELELGNSNNAGSILSKNAAGLATVLSEQPGSRTAPKLTGIAAALQESFSIANQLNGTRLQLATTQPDSNTAQNNGIAQGAAGNLLNIFT